MIRRLRIQFVAVCMVLVTAVLSVTIVSVFLSSERNIEQVSRAVLQRVLAESSSSSLPGHYGTRPGFDPEFGSGNVQLPYFTVQIWDSSTVFVTGGTYENLENTDVLSDILTLCMKQSADEGVIAGYDLRYLRENNGLYQQIAFVDTSVEQAALASMMSSHIQIALVALALLFFISLVLSYYVTRPVERAWRQQRQFLSDASHELKTPLTVILSNAELMESQPLPERQARWTDNIHSEAQRMKKLVEEMLTLARADNMVRTSVYTAVNLSDVATDCALLFEPVVFEAGKTLDYDIADQLDVTGDAGQLKQVISVLLDNAIKYGREGSVIRMTAQSADRHARLMVSNENAAGPIPPEQLKHLFERFYRADASRGEQSGFGLGLPIASAITAEHHGTLKAESDSQSTRFILTLPLKKG